MNSKRHERFDEIAACIRAGRSDRSIAEGMNVWRVAVRAIRKELGIEPIRTLITVDERLNRYCEAQDGPEGHVLWTGSFTSGGVPRLRHEGREVSVAGVVYERRMGRKPVGMVKADCGIRGCVAPNHLMDDVERRETRLLTRLLVGLPEPWDECVACAGSWEQFGRIDGELKLYCMRCATKRSQRNRSKKGK